ncbi:MAG TPA: glycosyltransferase family 4 protein [Vicinamibacterales bacterium]|jgi:glycosyltransferase involved in cell wall biosynthesis|nr:glycosyltransferase family 4 protein [Vicinamibacterales bacterium]
MRILYSAIDQVVPGTRGGSTHVRAVAEGLAALGHQVHALVMKGDGALSSAVDWIGMSPPLGFNQLRWVRSAEVRRIAERIRPDVIMERYYNFGGEAILHARPLKARAVLEVNAPVIDHPGSAKAALDRALLVRPMQRWRERLVRAADLIVTPTAAILPGDTPREKVLEIEWGADTDLFHPGAVGPLSFVPSIGTVAVFAGAFRRWHGAIHLARAIRELRQRGRTDVAALFIGDGPERAAVQAEAAGLEHVVFAGALPYEQMPAALASAHIGVAPFDIAAHKPLSLGFYWSPLKLFEYMAAGLPVVAPASARIPQLIEHGREGLLYHPADPAALARTLEELTDARLRASLGAAARDRAVREYSWRAHCEALDRRLRR